MTNDEKFTILVAEDDDATRTFLADNLTADGYELLVADCARHAIRLLETKFPDLAIIDLGLPDRDRGRLTEPYVTTREKGTGLGLAIVKRILEEHGGELVLTDAAARPGARVQLRFPSGRRSVQPDLEGPHVSQDRQFHGS